MYKLDFVYDSYVEYDINSLSVFSLFSVSSVFVSLIIAAGSLVSLSKSSSNPSTWYFQYLYIQRPYIINYRKLETIKQLNFLPCQKLADLDDQPITEQIATSRFTFDLWYLMSLMFLSEVLQFLKDGIVIYILLANPKLMALIIIRLQHQHCYYYHFVDWLRPNTIKDRLEIFSPSCLHVYIYKADFVCTNNSSKANKASTTNILPQRRQPLKRFTVVTYVILANIITSKFVMLSIIVI